MADVVLQHLQKVQYFRLVVHQRQHDDAERILHLSMLIELIQNDIGIGVPAQFDDHTGSLTVGFVPQIRDSI